MATEKALNEIADRLTVIENMLNSMDSYYCQALSKTLILKDRLEEIKKRKK